MSKVEKGLTSEEWKQGLHIMAEHAVSIPKGQKVGNWDRDTRIALVYSILCSLARLKGAPISI